MFVIVQEQSSSGENGNEHLKPMGMFALFEFWISTFAPYTLKFLIQLSPTEAGIMTVISMRTKGESCTRRVSRVKTLVDRQSNFQITTT